MLVIILMSVYMILAVTAICCFGAARLITASVHRAYVMATCAIVGSAIAFVWAAGLTTLLVITGDERAFLWGVVSLLALITLYIYPFSVGNNWFTNRWKMIKRKRLTH